MSLRRADPFHDLVAIQERINRLFQESLSDFLRLGVETKRTGWFPHADVYEGDQELRIRVELPGVRRDDLRVQWTEATLTISGERKEEPAARLKQHYVRERPYGSFCRTLALPAGIELDRITANLEDGILEVILPKPAAAKPLQATAS